MVRCDWKIVFSKLRAFQLVLVFNDFWGSYKIEILFLFVEINVLPTCLLATAPNSFAKNEERASVQYFKFQEVYAVNITRY